MSWNLESVRNIAEVTHINAQRVKATQTLHFGEGNPADLVVSVWMNDVRLVIKPHHLEILSRRVFLNRGKDILTHLTVGIRDLTQLAFYGRTWRSLITNAVESEEFWFKNNRPEHYKEGKALSPRWPNLSGPIIAGEEVDYLADLAADRPEIGASLRKSLKHLTKTP